MVCPPSWSPSNGRKNQPRIYTHIERKKSVMLPQGRPGSVGKLQRPITAYLSGQDHLLAGSSVTDSRQRCTHGTASPDPIPTTIREETRRCFPTDPSFWLPFAICWRCSDFRVSYGQSAYPKQTAGQPGHSIRKLSIICIKIWASSVQVLSLSYICQFPVYEDLKHCI